MKVASRHHLRSDGVQAVREALADHLGIDLETDTIELVEFADEPYDVGLVDGDPLIWYPDDDPFVTVQGANAFDPSGSLVTVDTGAISFVSDGADVMRPGIVEADPTIDAGDLVIVAEETHGKALAVGEALVAGSEMTGEQGKVVKSRHHVGDDLFELSV